MHRQFERKSKRERERERERVGGGFRDKTCRVMITVDWIKLNFDTILKMLIFFVVVGVVGRECYFLISCINEANQQFNFGNESIDKKCFVPPSPCISYIICWNHLLGADFFGPMREASRADFFGPMREASRGSSDTHRDSLNKKRSRHDPTWQNTGTDVRSQATSSSEERKSSR
jgi:hypothetical protein